MRCSPRARYMLALALLSGSMTTQAGVMESTAKLIDTSLYTTYDILRAKRNACLIVKFAVLSSKKEQEKKCGPEPVKPEGYDEWLAEQKEMAEQQKNAPLEPLRDGRPGGWFRAELGPGIGPGPLTKGAVLPHPPADAQ